MVSIENLSVIYRHQNAAVKALENFSLSIPEGKILAITGPSGCGKSTLLHVLAGVLTGYDGTISIDGQPLDPFHFSIGIVPQQYGLLPWKRAKENILLPAVIRKTDIDKIDFDNIVGILGLSELLDRYPRELSGGQCQRVALARVFLQRPQLLLLDEAFAALDMLTAEKSRQLFLQLWEEYRVTTIMVTHNIEEAVNTSHHVAVLGGNPGRLIKVFESPKAELIRQTLNCLEG